MTELTDLVLLADICEQYLGLNLHTAQRYNAQGKLGVPAFRLAPSRKAPLYVHKSDLAKYIDAKRKRATTQTTKLEEVAA